MYLFSIEICVQNNEASIKQVSKEKYNMVLELEVTVGVTVMW